MTGHTRHALTTIVQDLAGATYRRGATEAEAPRIFDCSSFTQYVLRRLGIDLPRSSILQAADARGREVVSMRDYSNLEIGDLIFMRSDRGFYHDKLFGGRKISIGHVGIYMGEGRMVSMKKSANSIVFEDLKSMAKDPNNQIVLVKRFL